MDQIKFGQLERQYEDNPNYFDERRQGIFHQMIFTDRFTGSGGTVTCGQSEGPPGDFSAASRGWMDLGQCHDDQQATLDEAVQHTVMHEFGHNDLSVIEPESEQCTTSETHDKHDDYALSCGHSPDIPDFQTPRWTEYLEEVDPPDGQEDGADEGDLNNGLQAAFQP